MTTQYYIRIRGTVRGPFTPEKLKELARRGQFNRVYHVSADGMNWEPAANHPELLPEAKAVKIRKQPVSPEVEDSGYDLADFNEPAPASGGESEATTETWQNDTPWYYAHAGREVGPVSFAELKQAALRGDLKYNDCVWAEGMSDWMEALSVPGLFAESDYAKLAASASGGYGAVPAAGDARNSPLAVASLICGILGLTMCPGVLSAVAIICGHLAPKPSGLAKAGLILGYVGVGIVALFLLGILIVGVLGVVLEGAA